MNKVLLMAMSCVLVLGQQLKAQTESKKHALKLSIGAETRGITLSYEKTVLPITKILNLGLAGFAGYGFNKSNWSQEDVERQPYGFPGSSWRMSTYFPFEVRNNSNRATYYLGDLQEYSLGVEANLKFGQRKHFLELGVGLGVDYFTRAVNYYASKNNLGERPNYEELQTAKSSRLADHQYLRGGYRYVSQGGITLGVGLSLHKLEGFFTHFYAKDTQAMPYLSVGYSF